MTVAIAAKCIGGVVLIADKEITLTDGSKTVGAKIYSRPFQFGTVTLASSTEDGLAAESLADEIFADLASLTIQYGTIAGIVEIVRKRMQEWHGAYTAGTAPGLSYLLVISAFNNQEQYVVEPPRTVLQKHSYSVGSGARVAQPILDRLIPEGQKFLPRASMMFLVYMAKRAAQETAMIGSGFDGLFIPEVGPVKWANQMDMLVTEEMVFSIDSCIDGVMQYLMMLPSDDEREKSANLIRDHIVFVAGQLSKQELFSSLEPTPSTSQT